MILVYTTCKNKKEAEKIGRAVLRKRLAACAVTIPGATSFYFWPAPPQKKGGLPMKNKIIKSREAILLLKTDKSKYPEIEREITRLHFYKTPVVLEIPVGRVNKKYLMWLRKEI